MHPAPFEYHRPSTLDEARQLLTTIDGARPLAGGHSLLPVMKQRLASPAALIDLAGIPGLDSISVTDGALSMGAMATHAAIAASAEVSGGWEVIAETAAIIGDRQVRNRGTIGGSVAHADPAADYPTVLLALGASIEIQGAAGSRTEAAEDFFVDLFTTSLQAGELVTGVSVPALGGSGAAYEKHKHPASGYAVVGVCAVSDGAGGGHFVVGGATGSPVKVNGTDPSAISGAISNPIGDVYASGEYRVHLATVLAKRALDTANERAG